MSSESISDKQELVDYLYESDRPVEIVSRTLLIKLIGPGAAQELLPQLPTHIPINRKDSIRVLKELGINPSEKEKKESDESESRD